MCRLRGLSEFTIVYRMRPRKCQSLITMSLPQRVCTSAQFGTWGDLGRMPGPLTAFLSAIRKDFDMDSMLRRLLATWMNSSGTRSPSRAHRNRALRVARGTATALDHRLAARLHGDAVFPPPLSRVQLSTRGAMGGQNSGGFSARGRWGGQNAGGIGTPRQRLVCVTASGTGGLSGAMRTCWEAGPVEVTSPLRQGQMPRATLQNMVEATPTTLPGGAPTVLNTSLPTDTSNVTTLPDGAGRSPA